MMGRDRHPRGSLAQYTLPRWLAWLTLCVLATLLLPSIGRFVAATSDWLNFPFARSGTEGLILYESLLLKHGENLYSPITPDHFISASYPPLYYWLAATTLPNTLPDLSDPASLHSLSLFSSGRAISLFAALLAAASIPVLVIAEKGYNLKDRSTFLIIAMSSVIGGILWLTLPTTIVWATTFRSDMLMLGMTAAGLACIAAGAPLPSPQHLNSTDTGPLSNVPKPETQNRKPLLLLGALLFALAFFSKQTAIPGPVAAAAYLLLRDWRAGLKWCGVMAALVLVPFALLDIVTGHWFYLKLVDYHSLPLRPRILQRLLQFAFLEDQWPLVLIALAYTLYRLSALWPAWKARSRLATPLLIPLFVLASFAMLPTGAVAGADHNHLLLSGLAVCAATGAALSHLLSGSVPLKWAAMRLVAPAFAALLLIGVYAVWTSPPSSEFNVNLELPTPAGKEQLRKIALNLHLNQGNLFFTDTPDMLALAGKQTPYDDPFTMSILSQQGRWDESALRDMLRSGKLNLLVLSCDVINTSKTCQLTPGVLDAVKSRYKVLFNDILYTYAPR